LLLNEAQFLAIPCVLQEIAAKCKNFRKAPQTIMCGVALGKIPVLPKFQPNERPVSGFGTPGVFLPIPIRT
jgi:hypothetical protein